MNCRTENCPNPVPRGDELCEKCRAPSHGHTTKARAELMASSFAALLQELWSAVPTLPTIIGLGDINDCSELANAPRSCHQPGLCGRGSMPYVTPGSDQVQKFVTVNGKRVLTWFCSTACYQRKAHEQHGA